MNAHPTVSCSTGLEHGAWGRLSAQPNPPRREAGGTTGVGQAQLRKVYATPDDDLPIGGDGNVSYFSGRLGCPGWPETNRSTVLSHLTQRARSPCPACAKDQQGSLTYERCQTILVGVIA